MTTTTGRRRTTTRRRMEERFIRDVWSATKHYLTRKSTEHIYIYSLNRKKLLSDLLIYYIITRQHIKCKPTFPCKLPIWTTCTMSIQRWRTKEWEGRFAKVRLCDTLAILSDTPHAPLVPTSCASDWSLRDLHVGPEKANSESTSDVNRRCIIDQHVLLCFRMRRRTLGAAACRNSSRWSKQICLPAEPRLSSSIRLI
jgi:hypothetical protein